LEIELGIFQEVFVDKTIPYARLKNNQKRKARGSSRTATLRSLTCNEVADDGSGASEEHFPSVSTGFAELKPPAYKSLDMLRSKLTSKGAMQSWVVAIPS
jgi:hypothetical protein